MQAPTAVSAPAPAPSLLPADEALAQSTAAFRQALFSGRFGGRLLTTVARHLYWAAALKKRIADETRKLKTAGP